MIRGTTPTYALTIPGYDLTEQRVFVTVSNNGRRITKSNGQVSVSYDGEASTVILTLTQEETLMLSVGTAIVQVRFIDRQGTALATEIGGLSVFRVLQPGVITYEGEADG